MSEYHNIEYWEDYKSENTMEYIIPNYRLERLLSEQKIEIQKLQKALEVANVALTWVDDRNRSCENNEYSIKTNQAKQQIKEILKGVKMIDRDAHDKFYEDICELEGVSYAYATLLDDMYYAEQIIDDQKKVIELFLRRVKAKDSLLVSYRVGKCPSEKTFKELEVTEKKLKPLLEKLGYGRGE